MATIDYQIIEQNLKSYEKKIQTLQNSFDNSAFNQEDILLKLDFDADNLIAFVQDKIAFQPYQGLLRGVQGTINSRSGNALDQAVLLAKLLNDAGLETRIAEGILGDDLAKQLLATTANAQIPQNIGAGQEFEQALAALTQGNKHNGEIDWSKTATYKRYEDSLNTIESVFKRNNIQLNPQDLSQQLMQQSTQYFWVEYRNNVTETWKSAHPAFNKNAQIDVKAQSHFNQTVPEKYLHQIRIEAFIQQKVGDKLITHSLMPAWQKPAANLYNTLITYSNAPSGVDINAAFDLTTTLKNTRFFTPIFNGRAVGGKVFDLKGRVIDATAMNSQAGALFQTVGDKTLSAIAKLDNKADSESIMQLTAQWLQVTFIHPDGTQYVQKRYLYQSQQTQETELHIKLQLLAEYSILSSTGQQPLSYLASVYLDGVKAGLPLLKASVSKLFNAEAKTAFPTTMPQSQFDLLTQYYWMQNFPDLDKNTIRFKAQPNMLGFKRGFRQANIAYFAVDIISNKQQFLQKQGDKFYQATKAAFKQGIWDTAAEWLPAKLLNRQGKKSDTLQVMRAAIDEKIPLLLLTPNEAGMQSLQTIYANNADIINTMTRDLQQDYLLLVPQQKPTNSALSGWWRINLNTGETLGMSADGGGQEMTEYAIEVTQIALSLVRALGGLQKCQTDNSLNDYEKLCCLVEAHMNNVGGLAFGSALGAAVGTSASAVFDILDFTAELATGSGIAPNTNGSFCKSLGPIPDF